MKKNKMKLSKFIYLAIIAFTIIALLDLGINPAKFFSGLKNLSQLTSSSFPPDLSLLPTAIQAIIETIEIAFLGTLLGTIISFPLSLLASRNLYKKRVTIPTRLILAMIRTLPSLLWAVIFVIMVGLGPLAGLLAIAIYTTGYLSKLQYEAIEGINPNALEALSGIGSKKLQLIRFVVIPEAANSLVSQILFMFEYNIRASSILGFVGAGGIGFYIAGYLKLLEYNKVLTLLIVVLVIIITTDYISTKIRDRFLVSPS